jgi:hypothetical protein
MSAALATINGHLPPHNKEAERAVIGGIVRDPDTLPTARTLVGASSFYFDAHQKIFAAICDLAAEQQPIDLVFLQERLKARKQLEDIGGVQYLAALWDSVPTGANVEYYAKLIRDAATTRGLIHVARETLRDAERPTQPVGELLLQHQQRISELLHAVEPTKRKARLASRSLAEVDRRNIKWVWKDRIAFGMFTMLDGDPSHGKSLITLDIAARLSRGRPMPHSDESFDPLGVLIVAAEDAVEEVIKPRALAADCDEKLLRVSETVRVGEHERPIRFPDDFDLLECEIRDYRIGMVVIDPLLGFLSQSIDSHKDQSIRDVLHRLKIMAAKTGVAVVGLRHMSKAGGSGNALYRGLGSIAIVAAARSALAVDWHPTDEGVRVLASTKNNLTKLPRALTYRIGDHLGQPVIDWGEECDLTADDIGAKLISGGDRARDYASEFLRDLLAGGPRPAAEVMKMATAAGISEPTLKRAKRAIKIRSFKAGFASTWTWELSGREEDHSIPD